MERLKEGEGVGGGGSPTQADALSTELREAYRAGSANNWVHVWLASCMLLESPFLFYIIFIHLLHSLTTGRLSWYCA